MSPPMQVMDSTRSTLKRARQGTREAFRSVLEQWQIKFRRGSSAGEYTSRDGTKASNQRSASSNANTTNGKEHQSRSPLSSRRSGAQKSVSFHNVPAALDKHESGGTYTPRSNPGLRYADDDGSGPENVNTTSTAPYEEVPLLKPSLDTAKMDEKTLPKLPGIVFLQYQGETKRAMLPEIMRSFDDVRQLFVRTFPNLNSDYMIAAFVKIYIQEPGKTDLFYELEDLKDVKDRAVLKLHDQGHDPSNQRHRSASPRQPSLPPPQLPPAIAPSYEMDDMNYFSEPEYDADTLGRRKRQGLANYYNGYGPRQYRTLDHSYRTMGRYASATLTPASSGMVAAPPKPGRNYVAPPPPPARTAYPPVGSMPVSTHEAVIDMYASPIISYAGSDRSGSLPRSGSLTPVIDEEARIRVENMEKQLVNLSSLVHSALMTQTLSKSMTDSVYRDIEALRREIFSSQRDDGSDAGSLSRFSDLSSDKGSYHTADREQNKSDRSPLKTSPNFSTSTQAKDFVYPAAFSNSVTPPSSNSPSQTTVSPEFKQQLRNLKHRTHDLQCDLRQLKRLAQVNAQTSRGIMRDAFDRIRVILNTNQQIQQFASGQLKRDSESPVSSDRQWVNHEQERYRSTTGRIDRDLSELERHVEELRQRVVSGQHKLRVGEVEHFTEALTSIGRTAATLKTQFPHLHGRLKEVMGAEMDKVVREERFLKEEPERLDTVLRRCKKLTNTMVTMKKLAMVQDPIAPLHRDNNGNGSLLTDNLPPQVAPSEQQQTFDLNKPKTANGFAQEATHIQRPTAIISTAPPKPPLPALQYNNHASTESTGKPPAGPNAAVLDSILEELHTVTPAYEGGESLEKTQLPPNNAPAESAEMSSALQTSEVSSVPVVGSGTDSITNGPDIGANNSSMMLAEIKRAQSNLRPVGATTDQPAALAKTEEIAVPVTAKTFTGPVRGQAQRATMFNSQPESPGTTLSQSPAHSSVPAPVAAGAYVHQRTSTSPGPASNPGFAGAIGGMPLGTTNAPRSRSGTPTSVSSEPTLYRRTGPPPPPQRSSSRTYVMGAASSPRSPLGYGADSKPPPYSLTSSKYSDSDLHQFKQQLITDFYRETTNAANPGGRSQLMLSQPLHTDVVDDDARNLKSASSSESVNSQEDIRRAPPPIPPLPMQ